jgi:hypothetical protein
MSSSQLICTIRPVTSVSPLPITFVVGLPTYERVRVEPKLGYRPWTPKGHLMMGALPTRYSPTESRPAEWLGHFR